MQQEDHWQGKDKKSIIDIKSKSWGISFLNIKRQAEGEGPTLL